MSQLPDFEIKLNAFEIGVLVGLVWGQTHKIPRVWEQLMAFQKKFREDSGVVVEEIGEGVIKLTHRDGTVIVRGKYDWEE